jgi:phage shock protein C
MTTNPPRQLTRLPADGSIAGVCAGLAAYLNVDVTFVRFLWVVLSIVPGGIIGGVLVYLVAWLVMPPATNPVSTMPGRRLRRSSTDVRIAGVCGGIAEYFNLDPTLVRLVWAVLTVVPGAIVLGVFAYGLAWIIIPRGVTPPMHPAPSPL